MRPRYTVAAWLALMLVGCSGGGSVEPAHDMGQPVAVELTPPEEKPVDEPMEEPEAPPEEDWDLAVDNTRGDITYHNFGVWLSRTMPREVELSVDLSPIYPLADRTELRGRARYEGRSFGVATEQQNAAAFIS